MRHQFVQKKKKKKGSAEPRKDGETSKAGNISAPHSMTLCQEKFKEKDPFRSCSTK